MVLERIQAAGRVAAKAAHPTDIIVVRGGFRVVAHNGGLSSALKVAFSELELALRNPLVDAVHEVNRAVA